MINTVVELFAGVGGFRLGLENNNLWKVIYTNQWEPGKKIQHAFNCYTTHFKDGIHSNKDIATVEVNDIPDHTLLVGGFPCQDYSVAATKAKGIAGKKGVLWWEIHRILEAKKPRFVLLENVDRLLKSPAKQRGRDFAIMLTCFNNLGYNVEWRVINAADYGFAQRRRRVFIFATKNDWSIDYLKDGLFTSPFPYDKIKGSNTFSIPKNPVKVSDDFSAQFRNSGVCINHKCSTIELVPQHIENGITLGDILEQDVAEKYYLGKDTSKWEYLKGSKREKRVTKDGFEYIYTEGEIAYPDYTDRPSRTILTSESSKNRSTHVIKDPQTGRLRLLTPVECERLDGFPDNWTNTGMTEKFRYFCMGNALVVDLIKIISKEINKLI